MSINLNDYLFHYCHGIRQVTVGNAVLYCGDSNEVLPFLNVIDSVVTDPPYGLSFMGKRWDYEVPQLSLWQLVLNRMKPGAHLLSFSAGRTCHRATVEIEDAGFEIRDQIMWLYGCGFPKSRSIAKDMDRMAGAKRDVIGTHSRISYAKLQEQHGARTFNVSKFARFSDQPVSEDAKKWDGWSTALKPAHEPIVMARKPLGLSSIAKNALEFGTGALNIDACRTDEGRWPANVIHDGSDTVVAHFPITKSGPASERKRRSSNQNAYTGKGIGGRKGEIDGYGDAGSAARFFYCAKPSKKERDAGLDGFKKSVKPFFQTANGTSGKSSPMGAQTGQKIARANNHPTVKPIALMAYLCNLVTPTGGTVLDPFMGSGSTGVAAVQEGFGFIGIEMDPEHFEIACARIAHAQGIEWD